MSRIDSDLAGIEIVATLPSNNNSVFVISKSQADADRVCGILEKSGYRSYWVSDVASLPKVTNNAGISNHCVAAVICHRKTENCQPMSFSQYLPDRKIVVLSDCDSEETVVSLLNRGAHYFFDMRESRAILQVRLEAALRGNRKHTNESFVVGDFYFNAEKRIVNRKGETLKLSPKEFDLAYYLFINRDRIIYNSELMISIWSLPASMDTRRIDTAACRIRKKLQLNSDNGWVLKRLRTIGYRLIPVQIDQPSDKRFSELGQIASSV